MSALPNLSKDLNSSEEYLPKEILDKLVAECEKKFFVGEMIPPYDEKDVEHILKYFAQKGECPNFYTFEHIDRNKFDVSKIAQKIFDKKLTLEEIKKNNPQLENELREGAFKKAKVRGGYKCAMTAFSERQVDF